MARNKLISDIETHDGAEDENGVYAEQDERDEEAGRHDWSACLSDDDKRPMTSDEIAWVRAQRDLQ